MGIVNTKRVSNFSLIARSFTSFPLFPSNQRKRILEEMGHPLLPYPPRSFLVTPHFGNRIKNNHGNCGKNVATLNAILMLSALKIVDDADITSDDGSNMSRAMIVIDGDANANIVDATSSMRDACTMTRNEEYGDDDDDDDDGPCGAWDAMERMPVGAMGANANDVWAASARHEKRAARHLMFRFCVL